MDEQQSWNERFAGLNSTKCDRIHVMASIVRYIAYGFMLRIFGFITYNVKSQAVLDTII